MSPRSRRTVRRLIFFAVIAVAIVVVALVALVADGVLVLPSNSSAPVTITSVHLEIDQGNTSGGHPWFGPSSIYYGAANGYPLSVAAGASWSVVWTFINFDDVAHTVYKVSPATPFTIGTTQPTLPYSVPAGYDDGALAINVIAPSNPGATFAVTLVVQAETVS